MSDRQEWFAPKRYGTGPGRPISWQGWAILVGFIAAVVGLALLFRDHPAQMIASVIPPTIIFLVIAAKTTRGGWRWRWGKDD